MVFFALFFFRYWYVSLGIIAGLVVSSTLEDKEELDRSIRQYQTQNSLIFDEFGGLLDSWDTEITEDGAWLKFIHSGYNHNHGPETTYRGIYTIKGGLNFRPGSAADLEAVFRAAVKETDLVVTPQTFIHKSLNGMPARRAELFSPKEEDKVDTLEHGFVSDNRRAGYVAAFAHRNRVYLFAMHGTRRAWDKESETVLKFVESIRPAAEETD